MGRLLVLPEQLLHVERKLNQIRCLLTAQSYLLRDLKDYNVPSVFLGRYTGQQDYIPDRTKKRIWTRRALSECPQESRTPSALKQSLGLKVSDMLPAGKTERLKFQPPTVVGGVHGKLSYYL